MSGSCANEIVECGECLAELEIQSVDPPVLGLAPDVEEDWGE
jgi:alpha-aminoadipate carrier protein LysW